MVRKQILVPQRLRQPPASGWSWVDRRFLREHGDYLSREAVLLYFFLASVADRHGLSFYGDEALATRLRLAKPKTIQVTASSPRVKLTDNTYAVVTFRQSYSSGNLKSVGTKSLQLVRIGDRWLIQQELIDR